MKPNFELNQQSLLKAFVALVRQIYRESAAYRADKTVQMKFSNPYRVFNKFGDTLNIDMFFFGSQFSSSSRLLWLLPGERGPPLETTSILILNYKLGYVTKRNLRNGYLILGLLPGI